MKTKRIVFYFVILSVVREVMVLMDLIVSLRKKRKKHWKETRKKEVQHEDLPGGITHPRTTLAQARLTTEC